MSGNPQGGSLLRWLVVLPIASLSAVLNWVLLTVLFAAALGKDGGIEQACVPAALAGGSFVYTGSVLAPSRREETAYALGFIGLLLLGYFRYWTIMQRIEGPISWASIAAVLGIVIAIYAIHREESKS